MKDFFKWLFETQLIKDKATVWRDFFMNAITLKLVILYVYQVINNIKISNEFYILLSMVLGFYFKNDSNKNTKV
jgi:hypothetical protein